MDTVNMGIYNEYDRLEVIVPLHVLRANWENWTKEIWYQWKASRLKMS